LQLAGLTSQLAARLLRDSARQTAFSVAVLCTTACPEAAAKADDAPPPAPATDPAQKLLDTNAALLLTLNSLQVLMPSQNK
jgi:hypothetical protein